ncbi:MAG: bifunctional folylpolyglutamate synthase/dihydrofolate synthase [Limisphaerales bacterium]
MKYSEAIQFLYGLRLFGAKFGLENTFKLAAQAGNPQERLRFIHVAGTNGKGSTCAMLESIYRAAGLRAGFFTSPHLVSFRERIQVNRQLISEEAVVRLVDEIQPALKQFPELHHPTFFEVITVMALRYFEEQDCDLVIWETGLGGRLDATNIVTPLAAIITNIALDHQQWLGDTLAKIAFEKAGIIKPGIVAVTTVDEPEALAVIEKIAGEKSAPLSIVSKEQPVLFRPPLAGDHQKKNAALALATIRLLQNQIPVSDEQIRKGLAGVRWPGRLQLVARPDGQKILLDCAHNVAGAKVLREALERDFPARKRTLILGVFEDKDWRHICEGLAPLAGEIFIVPVASARSANPAELAEACRAANPQARILVFHGLAEALDKIGSQESPATRDLTVITGSIYLIGEAMELLGLASGIGSERGLNDWTQTVRPVEGKNAVITEEFRSSH